MMKNAAVTCALTMCVLVPAGLHWLDAGSAEIAKIARPGNTYMVVGDATVDVSVDRALVKAGGKAEVTLRATAETERTVKVALIVHEASGSDGGRVELPPVEVDYRVVSLRATPEGGPDKTVSVKLRGHTGDEMDGAAMFGVYTFMVMSPHDGKVLHRELGKYRSAIARGSDAMGVDMSDYWRALNFAEPGTESELAMARLEVRTYKPSKKLRIEFPDNVREGDTFVANIVLTNSSRKDKELELWVARPWFGDMTMDPNNVFVADVGAESYVVPARGELVVPVEVTTLESGPLGLVVQASDTEGYRFASAIDATIVIPADPADGEPVVDNPWVEPIARPVIRVAEVH